MGISPSSASIISLPASAILPAGNYPTGAMSSPTSQSIFESLVSSGRSAIFQNPVGNAISGFSSNIDRLYDTVSNSTCLSGGDKTTIQNSIGAVGVGGLRSQLDLFNTHTRTLSGLIPGTGSTPSLDRVLSVGQNLSSLANVVDGAVGCLNILNNMTGLFSEGLVNGYASQITDMISQINNCLADAVQIAASLSQMANALANIINADNNFFQDALDRLTKASLASLLDSIYSNPCGKFLIDNRIGTNKLTTLLSSRPRI
jgi:hypothetical protein